MARLTFALQYRLPALVTGDVGAGKSTSLRAFLSSLDANVYPVAYLPNPHLNPQALYHLSDSGPTECVFHRVRFHLPPLDTSAALSAGLAETAGCIKHHLRIAGAEGTIFSDGVRNSVSPIAGAHQYTKGIARKINTLCLNALLIGCAQQQRVLDETTLKPTLLELGDNI